MSPFLRFGCFQLLLGLAALATLGCTPDLEKNEQFQTEKSRLDRVDGEQSQTSKDVNQLREELQNLRRNFDAHAKAKDAAAPSPETLNALQQRLATLENTVKALQAAQAASAKTTAAERPKPAAVVPPPLSAAPGVKPATAKSRAPEPANGVKTQVSVVSKPSSAGGSGKTARKPTATTTPKPPVVAPVSGRYYQVVKDDSIAAIAARFGVSPEAILAANWPDKNPSTSPRLFIGQNIYIPVKRAAK